MTRLLAFAGVVLTGYAVACDREQAVEEEPSTIPEPEETDAPDPKAHMRQHAAAGLRAREAVVAGAPGRAREALSWLSSHIYPETLPQALRPHAQRMQAVAREASQATDLPQAARAIGTLASTCGACHEHVDGGPARDPSGFEVTEDNDLPERMHRHAWALERMWDGLITPWDESFEVGAKVLAEGRLAALSQPESYSGEVRSELDRVRVLGRKALRARGRQARAQVYGELLSTCAACHRGLGVRLGDAPR